MPLNTPFFRYRASILRARGDDTPAVPAVPGTPPHAGFMEGAAASWLLLADNLNTTSAIPPVNFLPQGHFSWDFARWPNDAARWAARNNIFTVAVSYPNGISHIAVSLLDQQGTSRKEALEALTTIPIIFLSPHTFLQALVSIDFQISGREVKEATATGFEDYMLFTVSAEGFSIHSDPGTIHPWTDFYMAAKWDTGLTHGPWPNRIAIPGTGGGTPGRPPQDSFIYVNRHDHDSSLPLTLGQWSSDSNGDGTLDRSADLVVNTQSGAIFNFYLNPLTALQFRLGVFPVLLYSGASPHRWEIRAEATITRGTSGVHLHLVVTLNHNPTITGPNGALIDSAANWTVGVTLRVNYLIPGIPGGEGTSPAIPEFGGVPEIPEIPQIDGDPPVYQLDRLNTLYAEYVQHQQYETDGAYERTETWRIRAGAVQLFDWLSMTDVMDPFTTDPNPFPTAELIEVRDIQPETRTFDLVTGRRALVPLTYDGFGGYFEDPGMRRYNPRGAAIFVPSDGTGASRFTPARVLVRFGWAQTRAAVESVLLRTGNHPADGALSTATNTAVHPPPFPPALNTDLNLYQHIWISGSDNPTGIVLGGTNQIGGYSRIGELSVDGVPGILYVSNQRLSAGITAFFMEVQN